MQISDSTIEKLLTGAGKITTAQLDELKNTAEHTHRPLQYLALQAKVVNELELTKLYADYAHIPFVVLDPRDIQSEVLNKIPERIAAQYQAILFKIDEDTTMHLAMDDPDDVQAVDFIQKEIGENTKLYIATHENILACLENYRGDVNEKLNDVIDIQREDESADQQVSEDDVAEDSPVAQTINLLLEYAIRSSASDIHIEPREGFVQVRYRIDGVLKEVNRLPKNVLGSLISRIKILANLKIDEHRVPQDGRFKIKLPANNMPCVSVPCLSPMVKRLLCVS